jgi:hypothetical protein
MAGKQMGQKHEQSGKQKQDKQGNFGQDEARQQRDKESELSHMGEMTRERERQDKSN